MSRSFIVPVMIVILLFSCRSNEFYDSEAICIQNINIIDPQDGLTESQTVIIKNGKIAKILPSQDLILSSKNIIIDGKGKYLIPGLWDMHIHFYYIEELAPKMFNLFLANGITSVRDTGGDTNFVLNYKNQSLQNPESSPRVMMAGPLLDGIPNVYDGSDAGHPKLSVGLTDTSALRKKIEELDSLNVDFLKAYEMLTPEQFKLLMQLGKKLGYKVTGHVPLSMDVITASNAGLNSMEHTRNLELSCASNADELLKERVKMLFDGKNTPGGELRSNIHNTQRETAINNFSESKARAILKVLKENNTQQIPTIALNTIQTEKFTQYNWWKESIKSLPESIEQNWVESAQRLESATPTAFREKYSVWNLNIIKMIHNEGITIMAGTDSPIALQPPGMSLHNELSMLVKAGLTPIEALKAATIHPAKYFNLEQELGLIKEGYWADLIILNANPLENIEHTKSIESIFKQGKYYSREELNKLLEQ